MIAQQNTEAIMLDTSTSSMDHDHDPITSDVVSIFTYYMQSQVMSFQRLHFMYIMLLTLQLPDSH